MGGRGCCVPEPNGNRERGRERKGGRGRRSCGGGGGALRGAKPQARVEHTRAYMQCSHHRHTAVRRQQRCRRPAPSLHRFNLTASSLLPSHAGNPQPAHSLPCPHSPPSTPSPVPSLSPPPPPPSTHPPVSSLSPPQAGPAGCAGCSGAHGAASRWWCWTTAHTWRWGGREARGGGGEEEGRGREWTRRNVPRKAELVANQAVGCVCGRTRPARRFSPPTLLMCCHIPLTPSPPSPPHPAHPRWSRSCGSSSVSCGAPW